MSDIPNIRPFAVHPAITVVYTIGWRSALSRVLRRILGD